MRPMLKINTLARMTKIRIAVLRGIVWGMVKVKD
jgi:hypothetical protein